MSSAMDESEAAIARRALRPLAVRPTEEARRLPPLPGIRAFAFDVYGTLLISASGEIGTGERALRTETLLLAPADAFREAWHVANFPGAPDAQRAAADYRRAIERAHAKSRAAGVDFPEVDILAIWRQALSPDAAGSADVDATPIDPRSLAALDDETALRRFAVEYELRANPIWPMPGARETLSTMRHAGTPLALVSNAQFYTPVTIEAAFGASTEELGFADDLCVYSFRHGVAKPGTRLFEHAAERFAARGIAPGEVLFVGNDMLNDVTPAAQVGFRTALFAGDSRSLRKRDGDPRTAGVVPDAIVTELADLLVYLSPSQSEG